jgi:hypothetical protein
VDYLAALFPPLVMAVAFTWLIVTMVKSQGGANKYKEDAAVDAAIASRASVSASASARDPEHADDAERPERAGHAARPDLKRH